MKVMKKVKSPMHTIIRILPGFLLLAAWTGCSSVRMESYSDPEFEDRPIGKTMVLGVSDRMSTSREYEDFFVDSLTELGVDAVSCHALLQPTNAVNQAVLVEALEANGFKSIIVTRLVAERDHSQYVTMSPASPEEYGDYYRFYDYGISHEVGYVDHIREFILESNLYDVQSRQLIWTASKSIYDTHSDTSNIKGVVKAIVKDLDKKHILTGRL